MSQAVSCIVKMVEMILSDELVRFLTNSDAPHGCLSSEELTALEELLHAPRDDPRNVSANGRYRVCPTGAQSGFIQIVDGETLYNIHQQVVSTEYKHAL